eukprot:6190631-Pleurochrysis_carterae.AAC.2
MGPGMLGDISGDGVDWEFRDKVQPWPQSKRPDGRSIWPFKRKEHAGAPIRVARSRPSCVSDVLGAT